MPQQTGSESHPRRSGNLTALATPLERWQASLRVRRAAYLASQGPGYIPTHDPADVVHDCPGCGGTGWRRREDAAPRDLTDPTPMIERCPLCHPPRPAPSLSGYVIPADLPPVARHEMEHAREVIQMVIDSGGPPWIVLTGPNGSGKTMLASILLAARQRAGDYGQMWRAEELLGWLRETQGDLDHLPIEERETLGRRLAWLQRLKWLALDELGKERQTPWALEQMEALINRRYADKAGLIVTSNFDPLTMDSPFSPAVRSRFGDRGLCEIIRLGHVPDFRPRLRPGEREGR